MIDLLPQASGLDAGVLDTQTPRAANILSVQLGALEYAPTLGIDIEYFLNDQFKFQDASFQAYLVQVLAAYSINVATITEQVNTLYKKLTFNIAPQETDGSLIAR